MKGSSKVLKCGSAGVVKEKVMSWAIALNSKEHKGFAGIYNFIPKAAECQDGCRIAFFRTRKAARNAVGTVRYAWPAAKVARVEITVRSVRSRA